MSARLLPQLRRSPAPGAQLVALGEWSYALDPRTDHARPERRHRHMVRPGLHVQDSLIVTLPGGHGERSHAVRPHVAEGHRFDWVVGTRHAKKSPAGGGAVVVITSAADASTTSTVTRRFVAAKTGCSLEIGHAQTVQTPLDGIPNASQPPAAPRGVENCGSIVPAQETPLHHK